MGKIETTLLQSTKHGELRVFKLKNISRPEIWAHASLVAPDLNTLECSSKEAAQFYCHLCDDCFPHDATRLQNLHRHMKSKHLNEIQQNIQRNQIDNISKRKLSNEYDENKRFQRYPMHENAIMPSSNGPIHATVFHSRKHGPIQLFKVKHINRPEIWMYVSLVAPNDILPPSTGWTSRDASHFYCHLCDDCYPHDYVRSQNLHRHVKNKHRSDVESYMKKLIKTNEKLKGYESNKTISSSSSLSIDSKQSKQCELLLTEWLVTSQRPFEIVNDPLFHKFLHAIQEIPGEFIVPNQLQIENHLDELYLTRRKLISTNLNEKCCYYSLSTEILTFSNVHYLTWTLHYLTPTFEWIHLTISHQPLPNELPTTEWLHHTLNCLLHEWKLSPHYLICIVSDMDFHQLPIRSMHCLGRLYHFILGKIFGEIYIPSDRTDCYRENLNNHSESLYFPQLISRLVSIDQYFNTNLTSKRTLDRFVQHHHKKNKISQPVDCPSQWYDIYILIYRWHHMHDGYYDYINATNDRTISLTDIEWCILDGLLLLIEPFLQIGTIIFSKKPITSILFSILKLFLHDINTNDYYEKRGFLQKYQNEIQLDIALRYLNNARNFIHSILLKYMDENGLLWICSLHPSLAATQVHCNNENEKSIVRQRLLMECPTPKTTLKYMQQALGTEINRMDHSLEEELQTYFMTVTAGIEDPLVWWRTNQNIFPRLSLLARKWLALWPTTYSSDIVHTQHNEKSPRPDLIHRMAFLRATTPSIPSESFVI